MTRRALVLLALLGCSAAGALYWLPENLKTAKAYLDFQQFVSGGAGAKARLPSLPIDGRSRSKASD